MTDRRTFLRQTVLVSSGLLILPHQIHGEGVRPDPLTMDELQLGFITPPGFYRPHAYWMWMNGHITKKGITLDLEAMKRMGLGGALIYDTGVAIPRGPVNYGGSQWQAMLLHAVREANRLGLEIAIHNSPGFSSSGASWVTPGLSMQQLVWTETIVEAAGTIDMVLPKPFAKLNYYRDSFLIAYPSPASEKFLMKEKLSRILVNGENINKQVLLDRDPSTKIRLDGGPDKEAYLQMEFDEPFEARAITITRQPELPKDVFDGPGDQPPLLRLEASHDGRKYETVCIIPMPVLRQMDAPGAASFPVVKARYFRISTDKPTWISGVDLHATPRLPGWPAKTNCAESFADAGQLWDQDVPVESSSVLDISSALKQGGRIYWQPPQKGRWTILRFGHTTTGARSAATPDGAKGLEIDKFSRDATETYFRDLQKRVLTPLKSFLPKAFKGITIDSWEVGKQNWSKSFPSEFSKRRKYSIHSWMPALTGRVVNNIEETEKFLWDFRKTHADLVAENYYGLFKKKCSEAGVQLHVQANGDGIFDSLQAGQHVDIPMAEFWARFLPGTINSCKQAVSIAHAYGKRIAAAEAFTGLPATTRFTEYPYALKAQGDYFYSMGINRFVFHVFVHQPYTSGAPGMSMGPYGTHFDRNSTWINQARPWTGYLTRTQYLLQQGMPVADICYFKGEEPTTFIPDMNYVDPPMPRQFSGDVIGADALLRATMKNNKIIFQGGMSYSLLIMAPLISLSTAVARKLRELVMDGLTLIVTSRPNNSPGLTDKVAQEEELHKITSDLWKDLDGAGIRERSFGKGRICWNKPLGEILGHMKVQPDFEFTSKDADAAIHFTHRKIDDADFYFVCNQLRRWQEINCVFRVSGKSPEIWNAETGEIEETPIFEFAGGRTRLPLTLAPAGSLFVVFRKNTTDQGYRSISHEGKTLLSTRPFPPHDVAAHREIMNDFTISVWAKPDTNAPGSKGVLIFPPEGEIVYGMGHAACGLAAGQNGVRLFEREKGPNRDSRVVISYDLPLEGWTHIAVVYEKGNPSLYVNGRLSGKREGSGKIIHPGIGTTPTDELYSAYFEGNSTFPELFREALSIDRVGHIFAAGLASPDAPPPLRLAREGNGQLELIAFRNGEVILNGSEGTKRFIIDGCDIRTFDGPWDLVFPMESGIPATTLNKLLSLHRHKDFDIRHFSGTVKYAHEFDLDSEEISPGRRFFLDLGRVEVIASVVLNGKNLGILWKEPFMTEITAVLSKVKNKIEIQVTNLWPNRMIGDEYLPAENAYDQNNYIVKLPAWYVENRRKEGARKSFSVWNSFRKSDPLLESGLLGPVRLVIGKRMLIRH